MKLTTNNIEGTRCDVREDVNVLVYFILQFTDEYCTLLAEDMNKVFKNLEMKCWRQHFTAMKPFVTYENN